MLERFLEAFGGLESFRIKLKVLTKRLIREIPKINHKAKKLKKNIIRFRQENDSDASRDLAQQYLTLINKAEIVERIVSDLGIFSEDVVKARDDEVKSIIMKIVQIFRVLNQYISEGILEKTFMIIGVNLKSLTGDIAVSSEIINIYETEKITLNEINKFLKDLDKSIEFDDNLFT